jgi:hypothetical protein
MGGQREASRSRNGQVKRLMYFIVHIKSQACCGLSRGNGVLSNTTQKFSAYKEWDCNIIEPDLFLYYTPLKSHII